MTTPSEKIYGRNDAWIEYHAPMTCFTEIRLSQAEIHAQRYGLLGIGVNRHFVLERFGGPVHYVRNHCTECVVGNAQNVLQALNSTGNEEIRNFFAVNSAFIKAMSDNNTDNFCYLDEQEWRIIHAFIQEKAGNIINKSGGDQPEYRIPITPNDLRLLVFPDDCTRKLAIGELKIQEWFTKPPLLVTIDLHFPKK